MPNAVPTSTVSLLACFHIFQDHIKSEPLGSLLLTGSGVSCEFHSLGHSVIYLRLIYHFWPIFYREILSKHHVLVITHSE